MDEKLKKIVIGGIAGLAIVVAGFVAFQSMKSNSTSDGAANAAKDMLSKSNNTEVLSDQQKQDVLAHAMGPGGKPGALKGKN